MEKAENEAYEEGLRARGGSRFKVRSEAEQDGLLPAFMAADL